MKTTEQIAKDDLKHRFDYHPPSTDEVASDHQSARLMLLEAAEEISRICPDGREKSLALTKLEEAMFWANASIARHQ